MDLLLTPDQWRFQMCREQIACEIGGRATGKTTRNLAIWILRQMNDYPGNQGVVFSSTLPQLRQATIPGVHEMFDLVGQEYEYSEWKSTVTFPNGSWYRYQPLVSVPEDEIKGANLGFLGGDEVDACPETHIEKLLGGLRRPGTSQEARFVGNSPPVGSFLEKWFIPAEAARFNREPMGVLFQSSTYDNHFLTPKYVKMMERMWPPGTVKHRRYMLGEMRVPLEGAVYDRFENRHVVSWDDVPWNRIVGYVNALDLGSNHYTVFLRAAITDDDCMYVISEHAARRTLLRDHAIAIRGLRSEQGAANMGTIFCDHDAQDRLELASLGVDTVPALKGSKALNIDAVNLRFGEDRLFIVGERCPHLLSEIPYYVWSEVKDEPVKKNDDACFAGDVEVMTLNGWVRLDAASEADTVLAVDECGVASWERPQRVVSKLYSGGMHRIRKHNLSFDATDDHRHAVIRQMDYAIRKRHFTVRKTVDEMPAYSFWPRLPAVIRSGPGLFDSVERAYLSGMWLAEGSLDTGRPTFVLIDQKKIPIRKKIYSAAVAVGFGFSETCSKMSGCVRYVFSRQREWADWLKEHLGSGAASKKLKPSDVMRMTRAERRAFFEGYMDGDGCRTQPGWHYDTVSPALADGVQFLCATLGYPVNLNCYECFAPGRTIRIAGRESVGRHQGIRGSVHRRRSVASVGRNEFERYEVTDLPVYCVTTSTGRFWARHRGKPFVAGNCDTLQYLVGSFDRPADWFEDGVADMAD